MNQPEVLDVRLTDAWHTRAHSIGIGDGGRRIWVHLAQVLRVLYNRAHRAHPLPPRDIPPGALKSWLSRPEKDGA